MAVNVTTNALPYILKGYYTSVYRKDHKNEFDSTSPYATTSEIPTLRIVDNAITKGSWSGPSAGVPVYGFFGGFKGTRGGGGGGGSIDTEVQFDRIYMCPVTGREFLEKDMKRYKENLDYQAESWGDYMAKKVRVSNSLLDKKTTLWLPDGREVILTRENLGAYYISRDGMDEFAALLDEAREALPNNDGPQSAATPDAPSTPLNKDNK